MDKYKRKFRFFISKITFKNSWKAFLALLIGLILTILSAFYIDYDAKVQAKTELTLVCNEIKTKIFTRLQAHAQLLRSASSFFAASDTVTRKEWKSFNEHGNINKNLPGIQGVGFSQIIPKNELQQHIQKIRNEGFPNYTIKPAGERDIYTSIIFLEPFSGRNLRAFGYDMFSEPIRRKAMEISRDSNLAMLSGKVILVQETDKSIQFGTLMYVPVYCNGKPTKTATERRNAILGWVYSPYRMNDLMNGILDRRDLIDKNRIHLQIYDNYSITESSILYDSQSKDKISNEVMSQNISLPLEFNGKKWTLFFTQNKERFSFFNSKVNIVLVGGFFISILLFSLLFSLLNTKLRAKQIADKLILDLKDSENRFSIFMDYIPAIVFIKDNEGKTLFVNKHMDNVLGASKWMGKTMFEIFPNEFGKKMVADDLRVLKLGYQRIEESIIQLDNEIHHYETQKFIIRQDGQKDSLGGICLDITERKLAEAKVKEINQSYRNLADSGNILVWSSGLDKLCNYFNKPWLEFTGRTLEQETGNGWTEGIHPEDLNRCMEVYINAFERKEIFSMDYRLLRYDGEYRWIQDIGSPTYNIANEFIGYIGHCQDITEREIAKETIKIKNERLILADLDKDRFLGILAHDLKSPFNAILGFLELLSVNIRNYNIDEIEEQI
ncbi:MAG: CHASE domain-containing protein, partial [Bacteroidetes bacterium]|nr:CHASE domain-containing protein [Bacteroidota bacterium]